MTMMILMLVTMSVTNIRTPSSPLAHIAVVPDDLLSSPVLSATHID